MLAWCTHKRREKTYMTDEAIYIYYSQTNIKQVAELITMEKKNACMHQGNGFFFLFLMHTFTRNKNE